MRPKAQAMKASRSRILLSKEIHETGFVDLRDDQTAPSQIATCVRVVRQSVLLMQLEADDSGSCLGRSIDGF